MLRYLLSFLKQKQNVINHKFVSSNTNVLIRQQSVRKITWNIFRPGKAF